jgi:hypothetical protein
MSHSWRQCAACGGEANLEDKLSQLMHTYESLTPRLQDMVHRTWCGMFEYLRNSDDIVNIQIVQTWIGHMEGRQSRIVDLMKPEERSSACDIVMGVMSQLWNVTIHVYKLQRGDTIIYNRSIQPSGGTAEVVIDVLQAGGKWFSMMKTTSVKGMKVMSTTGVTFIVLNSIMAPAIEDDVGPEAWATTIDIVYNLVNLALLRNPEFKSHLPPMKVPRDLNLLKEPLPGPNCHAIYSLTKEIITILDGSQVKKLLGFTSQFEGSCSLMYSLLCVTQKFAPFTSTSIHVAFDQGRTGAIMVDLMTRKDITVISFGQGEAHDGEKDTVARLQIMDPEYKPKLALSQWNGLVIPDMSEVTSVGRLVDPQDDVLDPAATRKFHESILSSETVRIYWSSDLDDTSFGNLDLEPDVRKRWSLGVLHKQRHRGSSRHHVYVWISKLPIKDLSPKKEMSKEIRVLVDYARSCPVYQQTTKKSNDGPRKSSRVVPNKEINNDIMSPTHTSSSKNSTPSSTNSQSGKRKSNKLRKSQEETTPDALKKKLFRDGGEEEPEEEEPEKEEPKKNSRNNRKSKRSGASQNENTEDHGTSGEDLFSDAGGEGCQQKILDQLYYQLLTETQKLEVRTAAGVTKAISKASEVSDKATTKKLDSLAKIFATEAKGAKNASFKKIEDTLKKVLESCQEDGGSNNHALLVRINAQLQTLQQDNAKSSKSVSLTTKNATEAANKTDELTLRILTEVQKQQKQHPMLEKIAEQLGRMESKEEVQQTPPANKDSKLTGIFAQLEKIHANQGANENTKALEMMHEIHANLRAKERDQLWLERSRDKSAAEMAEKQLETWKAKKKEKKKKKKRKREKEQEKYRFQGAHQLPRSRSRDRSSRGRSRDHTPSRTKRRSRSRSRSQGRDRSNRRRSREHTQSRTTMRSRNRSRSRSRDRSRGRRSHSLTRSRSKGRHDGWTRNPPAPKRPDVSTWDCEEVVSLLKQNNFSQIIQSEFFVNQVCGADLLNLTEADMKRFKMTDTNIKHFESMRTHLSTSSKRGPT